LIRVYEVTAPTGVGVGVATRTLSRVRSVLCVLTDTSVKVRVVELLFATKVNACGVHHVPVPCPVTEIVTEIV
jgi:hypothetical protein